MFAPWWRCALALAAQTAAAKGAARCTVEIPLIGLLRACDRGGRAGRTMCVGRQRRLGFGLRLVIERVVQHLCEAHACLFDLDSRDIARTCIIAVRQRHRRRVTVAASGRAERVGHNFCQREGLARPVAWRPGAPGRGLCWRYAPTQGCGKRLGIGCDLTNDDSVPVAVEVGRSRAAKRDADTVAAAVLMIGGVQRLVHIADEVEDELEGEPAFGVRRCGVAEFAGELFDLGDYAVLCRPLAGDARPGWKAEACRFETAAFQLDVREMPGGGEAVGSAPHIRPCGACRHVGSGERVAVAGENGIDLRAGSDGQIAPRDERDCFMPFISPGVGGRWDAKGKRKNGEETVHAAALPCRPRGEKLGYAAALA